LIRLERVSKTYPDAAAPAVRSVSLHVEEGTLLVLLGESGSGKTTTLKMINRLVEPTEGRIAVAGQDTRGVDPVDLRRQIGYAFQGIGLFPHMSVAANVALVPRMLGWPPADIEARVDELLDIVGLRADEFRERLPSALSGGQQQRVGVARALAARSKILLMDEPFGALDPLTRDELQIELKRLQRALNLTVVLVTHDIAEALLLADRIAVMKDGALLGDGAPAELLSSPPHEYIARLMSMPRRQAELVARMAGTLHG
jgi:osmoprotectant transport system ATP-binding protein